MASYDPESPGAFKDFPAAATLEETLENYTKALTEFQRFVTGRDVMVLSTDEPWLIGQPDLIALSHEAARAA